MSLCFPFGVTEPFAFPKRIVRSRIVVACLGKASVGNGWCGVKPECVFSTDLGERMEAMAAKQGFTGRMREHGWFASGITA
jgi:hypothetical protein